LYSIGKNARINPVMVNKSISVDLNNKDVNTILCRLLYVCLSYIICIFYLHIKQTAVGEHGIIVSN